MVINSSQRRTSVNNKDILLYDWYGITGFGCMENLEHMGQSGTALFLQIFSLVLLWVFQLQFNKYICLLTNNISGLLLHAYRCRPVCFIAEDSLDVDVYLSQEVHNTSVHHMIECLRCFGFPCFPPLTFIQCVGGSKKITG